MIGVGDMALRIHRMETTVSTNLDAHAGAHGDVYVAEFQTAGRGRLDHRWLAPRGENLIFSAVFDVAGLEPGEIATFPLVVGLAVIGALNPLVPSDGLALKWPNDILSGGRKLAGILCERDGDKVIAGIGINVNQTVFPQEIASRATSLALLSGKSHEREHVLAQVLESLYVRHAQWRQVGFAALLPEFAAIDHLAGKTVSVLQTDTDPVPITGLCGGIQDDGTLLVGDTRIYAGEAHLTAGF